MRCPLPPVCLGVCYYFLFSSETSLTVRHTWSGQLSNEITGQAIIVLIMCLKKNLVTSDCVYEVC
jgi:hypothetical protein